MNNKLIAAGAALTALAFAGATLAAPARPRATVETGAVLGVQEAGVAVFKGIPYAAPPVGPLRWKATQRAAPWTGVRDASAYGAACPQDGAHTEAWAKVGRQSEDCLFLNIWKPTAAKHAPVMVFLHGGGFTYGSAGVPLYDGANLARRGVVLVSMNYRLGRLGFFAHPALTAEDPAGRLGNYGVMDQAEALRWVQRNITAFGGDPKNVTVFGESAGAGTVQILMGSSEGEGLFAKAVSESGSGGTALQPLTAAEALGERWSKSLGMTHPSPADLRAIPVEKTFGRAFPFIDGKVVRQSPGVPFRAGTEAKTPLIIGSNSDEASLVGSSSPIARMALGPAYAGFVDEYRKRPGVPADAAERDLLEDVASVQESLFLADMHAKSGAPTFAYYFDQVFPEDRGKGVGTEHGGELEYLFGNKADEHSWDADDRRVSTLMGDYWVRFAKTGNPNGPNAPQWKPVHGHPTDYMAFGARTASTRSTDVEERVKAATLTAVEKLWSAETDRRSAAGR